MSEQALSFYIDGVRCLGCVGQIEKALRQWPVVEKADINFDNKVVDLRLKDWRQWPQIRHSLKKLGFDLLPANSSAAMTVAELSSRRSLKEIAVAGACAGNIMLFTIPIYAGLKGPLVQAFANLSGLLFLPVLLYSSRSFFQGALGALRSRMANIDLPIAMAVTLTSALSYLALMRGTDQFYFDSTASFIFLILTARYLTERSRQKLLVPVLLQDFLPKESFRRQDGQSVSAREIRPGDHLLLSGGQIVPVDAVNQSANATYDSSLVDGESIPRCYAIGAPISSGFRVLDQNVSIVATTGFEESRLAKFLHQLNRTGVSDSSFVRDADRWASALIVTVVFLSLGVMLSGYWFGWEQMLHRGTALLVIACPCALAFAAPMTVGSFLKKALRRRIFLKDADTFERLAHVKNVFLDKTGTLTEGQLELIEAYPPLLTTELQSVILALEEGSAHPVAFAFRQAWSQIKELPEVKDREESLGQGVRGWVDGHLYELRALPENKTAEDLCVGFYRDGQLLTEFYFRDQLRAEAPLLIAALKQRGLQVFLLSGDRRHRVQRVAEQLGIPSQNVFCEVFPEEKEKIIARYPNSLMVGDGFNDGLALAKADVGVAVRGSLDATLKTAKVFLARPGLQPLMDLFDLKDRCYITLKRNLRLALIYNSIGGFLAISGFVNPLVAAVAMPISSLVILLSTLWGVR